MPQLESDLTTWSASAIAEAVRTGRVTPEEVVAAHLARIDAVNPGINAFQIVRRDDALREARELASRSDLATLPLAGVPVAIKDNVDVAGEPTRHGSHASSEESAAHDDEGVRRLRAAGAIVIGKTKQPELAIWPFTESAAFGVTRNPYDLARTAGGSSGGSAAAVAARMAPLALGSDGGGSIRIPAACCGVYGLKPGPDVIPLPAGAVDPWFGMSEAGPFARNAEDLAAACNALADRPIPLPPRRALRIALSTLSPTPGAMVSGQVKRAVRAVGARLAARNHAVIDTDPPYPADLGIRFTMRWLAAIAKDAAAFDAAKLEPRTQAMARAGQWITRRGWAKHAEDERWGREVRAWLRQYDVLLMPTLARPAVAAERWKGRGWLATTFGVANWIMTPPWNLARVPAASMPIGMSRDGLPIGLQLVASRGGEGLLLQLMREIETGQAAIATT